MAHYDRIQPIKGAQADAALEGAMERFDAQELRTEVDAHHFVQRCRGVWEADAKKDRNENVATELVELFVTTPAAGALAAWKTKNGFRIGEFTNLVVGAGAKAVSIGLAAKLPNFELINDAPPEPRRLVRSLARAGKVLLHSQGSMWTRELIEDDK
jgi:hypothetical protein